MPNARKERKEEESIPLSEHERLLEVIFHATLCSEDPHSREVAAASSAFLDVSLNGETKRVLMSEVCSSSDLKTRPSLEKDKSDRVIHSMEIRRSIIQRRVPLSLPVLESLFSISARDFVSVHVTVEIPPPETPTAEVELTLTSGKRKKPRASNANRAKEKGKPSKEVGISTTRRTDCLCLLPLSLTDLLKASSSKHELCLERPLPGVSACSVELRCTDRLLLPPELMEKYRPLLFKVQRIDGLPCRPTSLLHQQGPKSDAGTPVNQAALDPSSQAKLYMEVRCLGHTLRDSLPTSVEPSKDLWQAVIFLSSSTPLRILQQLVLDRVSLQLLQGTDDNHLPVGAGSFSIKEVVTHNQTEITETVQLLPSRTTLSNEESCLTCASTVKVSLDFCVPFPRYQHVDAFGCEMTKQFLTRAVLIMPYNAPWMQRTLECFIHEVLKSRRADRGSDVHLYRAPEQEPVEVEEPAPTKKGKQSKAGRHGAADSLVSPSSVPPPLTPFEVPFQVVSPAGISGFEVMDGERRIVCVEGTVQEVHRVLESTAIAADHDSQLIILFNSELFIPRRSYIDFPPLVSIPSRPRSSAAGCDTPWPSYEKPHVEDQLLIMTGTEIDGNSHEVAKDADGMGGRLHCIRLRETVRSLMLQKRYLLKRTLSASCLKCIQKLYTLMKTPTMRSALELDLFPSSGDIISLERSFGQTLDWMDIFGRQEFVNISKTSKVISAVEERDRRRDLERQEMLAQVPSVNLCAMKETDVGRFVSFDGVLLLKNTRAVPPLVTQRYRCGLWMVTDNDHEVLCAFPKNYPGGTIRYHVDCQVVRCGDLLLLYVCNLQTLAKSFTVASNPVFEEHIKRRALREKATSRRRAAQSTSNGKKMVLVEDTMCPLNLVSVASGSATCDRLAGSSSSNDSGHDSPPMCPDTPSRSCSQLDSPKAPGKYGASKGTRCTELLASMHRRTRSPGEEYEMLWKLYDASASKRAPAGPPQHSRQILSERP